LVRVLSAAALIVIVVATIWVLPWWATLVAAAIVAFQAGRELAGMAGAPPAFVGLAAALATIAFVLGDPQLPVYRDAALPSALLTIAIASGLVALSSGPPSAATLNRAGMMALAPLYVGLPLGAIAAIRGLAGPAALTWMIAVIATSDSAQYYTGRAFGRRKLAPAVSPAKTVEGAIGGLTMAAIGGAAIAIWALPSVHPAAAALLALLLATIGITGDLFESMLKRSAGVKDSSAVIPGHGGALDRIDSYLFAGPFFYLFLRHIA
jgi:phosphatidate cytidylyltransferase